MLSSNIRKLKSSFGIVPFGLIFFLLVIGSRCAAQSELPDTKQLKGLLEHSVVAVIVYDDEGEKFSQSVGCIIGSDLVLTNYFYVEEASYIEIKTSDDSVHEVETVLRTDKENDLALLKIRGGSLAPVLSVAASPPKTNELVFLINAPDRFYFWPQDSQRFSSTSDGRVLGNHRLPMGTLVLIASTLSPKASGLLVTNSLGEIVGLAILPFVRNESSFYAAGSERIAALLREPPNSPSTYQKKKDLRRTASKRMYARGFLVDNEHMDLKYDRQQVITYYERATAADPTFAAAWFRLGAALSVSDLLAVKEKYGTLSYPLSRSSVEAYQKSLELEPYPFLKSFYYGSDCAARSPDKSGKSLCQLALELNPDNIEALESLGFSYQQSADYASAIKTFRQILERDSDAVRTRYFLGRCYLAIGNKSAAMEQYHEIVGYEQRGREFFTMGHIIGYAQSLQEEISKSPARN